MGVSKEYGSESLLRPWGDGPGQWLYRVKKHIASHISVAEQSYLKVKITLVHTGLTGVEVEGKTIEFYYRDWYSGNRIAPAGVRGASFRFEIAAS